VPIKIKADLYERIKTDPRLNGIARNILTSQLVGMGEVKKLPSVGKGG